MNRRGILLVASALLAAAQIGFLSWMIESRASILRNGREVLLKVEPVDPRDLLRGDYVRLGYGIGTIPAALIGNLEEVSAGRRALDLHVRLQRQEDGYWGAVAASFHRPVETPLADDEVDIRGTVQPGGLTGNPENIRVEYGIERFYLPEGEGRAIERDMRVRPFSILLAISSSGTAQIKALMDGQTKLFEEPLY
jgi:uncharacterized membrane-anchored protein